MRKNLPSMMGHNSGISPEAAEELLRFKVAVGNALSAHNLKGLEKLAEIALLWMLNPEDGAHPSSATIGDILGVSDSRTVRKLMRQLEDGRWEREEVRGLGTIRRPSRSLEIEITVAVNEYRSGRYHLGGKRSLRVPLSEVIEIAAKRELPPASHVGGPPASDVRGQEPPTSRAGGHTDDVAPQAIEIARKKAEPPTSRAGGGATRGDQAIEFAAKNGGPPARHAPLTVEKIYTPENRTTVSKPTTTVADTSASLPLFGGDDGSVSVEIDSEWNGRTTRITRTVTVADLRVLVNRYSISQAEAAELSRAVLNGWRDGRYAGGREWLKAFYADAEIRRRAHLDAAAAPRHEASVFKPEFPGHFKVR